MKHILRLGLPVAIILISLFSSCSKQKGYRRCEGMIWNTLYHITYQGAENLQDSILPLLAEIGKSLSVFESNSLISQLNDSDSIKADSHLIKVYDASRKINEVSKGNFDPTVSPLVDAWGFGIGHNATSDTLALDSIMNFIGIQRTHRESNTIFKDDIRTRFNFSAIAKGYGCDALGEMFRRNGVENFMIEIGGELTLSGNGPSGTGWNIAIDAPQEGKSPGEETAMILTLTNVGVATSGNYRNYKMENGKKTVHTVSPKTGRPFIGEILSATVIAPTCMEADGLATACMASTAEEAKTLLQETHTEGLLIFKDSIWTTPSFGKFIKEHL